MNFRNILHIATYESKTLFRSWFFRIFAILSLLILFGTNMGFYGGHSDAAWLYRAIEANLPYMNVLFMNVAQAMIAIFLASDFLKQDKKLDTTEVIYTRPITNGEYVVGKTLGILLLFLGLLVLSLLMVLVFNLVRKDTPVAWDAYVLYPLLISLPTLVYILGLSFFMMILSRSQAVTFLVLLGYVVLTLAFFQDKLYGLLDYMAFNLPMVHSDFIGFARPERILLHRAAYLFLGIGFIFATIRYLNRLPQTGRWNFLNTLLFLVFMAGGAFMAYSYHASFEGEAKQREIYLACNEQYAKQKVVDLLSNDMDLEQEGNTLKIHASLRYQNRNNDALDTLVFSLNPGFHIDSLNCTAPIQDWVQKEQVLLLIPEKAIAARERGRLDLWYQGTPDASLAYLDLPQDDIKSLKKSIVATYDKEAGILDPSYILLTPELNWYPRAGVGFNLENFQPAEPDFLRFSLEVAPDSGLTAIAPGAVDTLDGKIRFRPEQDLNAYALVLAPLEKRSLQIGNVEYAIFLHPEHDFFSGYFSEIGDTIPDLIKEAQNDYEIDDLDLYYPFDRISLVEVPIQYHAYERPYIQSLETILPEMILLPEKGAGLNTMDFERFKRVEERRDREQDNKRSDREIQVDQFKRFLQNTFFRTGFRTTGLNGRRGGGERLITFNEDLYSKNPYHVFPLYYSHVSMVSSPKYPVFNSMLEIYLKEGFEVSPRDNFTGGVTDREHANLALSEASMVELFARWDTELTSALITQTGSFVFAALRNRVGSSEFDNFLYYYLEDHAFREISFEQLSRDFHREFGFQMEPYLEIIGSGAGMARFKFSETEFIQTRDDIGDVYLVRYQISNLGNAMGLVEMNYRIMGQGGFGGGSGPEEEKIVHEIPAGETRDIQVVLYERPMMATINTLISSNIPSSWNVFLRSATEEEKTHMEPYERTIDKEVNLVYEGEYVVDNEDESFTQHSVSGASKVKNYLETKQEEKEGLIYEALHEWWVPHTWTPMAHSAYYGETIKSAMAIRGGTGDSWARWATILPEKGFYELYTYIPRSAMLKRPNRNNQGQGGGSGGGPGGGQGRGGFRPVFADKGTDYHYLLESSEGSEDILLELDDPEEGWNYLGAYLLPADSVKVTLSNETNGRRVLADAIKFVRIN